ncbi:hypothetical protein NDU88_011722, partial [Pleurodeles waltl]
WTLLLLKFPALVLTSTMEAWKLLCALILTSFLVCPSSSAHLEGYQADDWSASHLLEETVDQYVKPYTGALVEAITTSRIWAALG